MRCRRASCLLVVASAFVVGRVQASARAREDVLEVNPSFSSTVVPGAEAPKRSRPRTSPSRPTHFHQLIVAPGSTARRGLTAGGSTSSR